MGSDEQAGPGELGRVVVTDYFSDAMPLIRYDTGDTAILSERTCDCGLYGPVFEKIGGRFVENIHSTDGKIIHSMAISHLLTLSQNIVQYQFKQISQFDYLIKLIVKDDFSDEETLRKKLKNVLGEKAKLSFEYVDTIEALPSGKRPYIINEYVKNANYDLR
jgi:phenylacetate-CoA ligase